MCFCSWGKWRLVEVYAAESEAWHEGIWFKVKRMIA